jgi:hypothetical protein
MPKAKKKTTKAEEAAKFILQKSEDAPLAAAVAEIKEIENALPEPQKSDVCGHRNMHYAADVLTCTLPKGHEGNHHSEAVPGEWSDAAGTPPRKHA